jgi:hypothetical protein
MGAVAPGSVAALGPLTPLTPRPPTPGRVTARKPVAIALVALTVAGFALLGLAVWGVPGLASVWPGLAVGSAIASLLTLVLFWDRQLAWGMVIDVAIIVVALWRPGWTDRLG